MVYKVFNSINNNDNHSIDLAINNLLLNIINYNV